MKDKKIKNIIFDFGGVLIDLNRSRCIENFKKLGLLNVEELIDPFRQQGIFMQLEKGIISVSEFRDKVRQLVADPLTDQQIDNAWNSFLESIDSSKLDMLLGLREKYNLYLLSNTNQIHWDWSFVHAFPYKGFIADDYFNQIFLSYELHQVKPDKEIFETVIRETAIVVEETLFIDDSRANCNTAGLLGMSTFTPKDGKDWMELFR